MLGTAAAKKFNFTPEVPEESVLDDAPVPLDKPN